MLANSSHVWSRSVEDFFSLSALISLDARPDRSGRFTDRSRATDALIRTNDFCIHLTRIRWSARLSLFGLRKLVGNQNYSLTTEDVCESWKFHNIRGSGKWESWLWQVKCLAKSTTHQFVLNDNFESSIWQFAFFPRRSFDDESVATQCALSRDFNNEIVAIDAMLRLG